MGIAPLLGDLNFAKLGKNLEKMLALDGDFSSSRSSEGTFLPDELRLVGLMKFSNAAS